MKQEQIEALGAFAEDHYWTEGDIADVRSALPQLLAEREALLGALRAARVEIGRSPYRAADMIDAALALAES